MWNCNVMQTHLRPSKCLKRNEWAPDGCLPNSISVFPSSDPLPASLSGHLWLFLSIYVQLFFTFNSKAQIRTRSRETNPNESENRKRREPFHFRHTRPIHTYNCVKKIVSKSNIKRSVGRCEMRDNGSNKKKRKTGREKRIASNLHSIDAFTRVSLDVLMATRIGLTGCRLSLSLPFAFYVSNSKVRRRNELQWRLFIGRAACTRS